MAQLKDSIVSGNLRVTDTTLTDTLHVTTIKAPTSSGGTTYGPGTSGQVLKSNGTATYWADMPTIPSNNVTGSGTSGYLTKWNGTNTITNGPQLGSSTTTFLRNDGSWATPTNTDTQVNVTLATTSKAYLLGTTTTPTATATGVTSVADTGVYLTTTAGELCATKFMTSGKNGYYTHDADNTKFPLVYSNATNLWVGAEGSTSYPHKGETFISAGWLGTLPTTSGETLTGNSTIRISVPKYTAGSSGGTWSHTGYYVLHTGNTSFTQSLPSGTKIGSIKINGSSTDIYAPTNTNTTYTFATGDAVGQFKVTPSGGSPANYNVNGINAGTNSGTANHLAYYSAATTIDDSTNIIYSVEDSTASTPRSRTILHLVGNQTVGNEATQLVGGVKGVLSYGDGGPQINFSTSATIGGAQDSSIIWTDNNSAAYGASWHFVSKEPDWTVVSKRFHARTGISIGTEVSPVVNGTTASNTDNLYVVGTSQFKGDVKLKSDSGDSPALIFQRGTFVDNLNDWKIYVSGGALYFAQSTANASSETWTNKMYFHASDGNLYVGSTKVSLNGHTHSYAGSSSAGGAATNADVTVTDVPSTSTTTADSWYKSYSLIFAQNPNTTQANTLRKSHNLRFYHSPNGTADTVGVGELIVGNNTASGTAGNMQGRLLLYSSSSSYISMIPTATSSPVTLTLPAVTGTVPSFTATPTSGQVVIADGTGGGIKTGGYTIATSVPSGAVFTDENVKQSNTSGQNYRPLVLGTTHTSTVSDLNATVTGQTYVTTNLYANPSTGNIFTNGKVYAGGNNAATNAWPGGGYHIYDLRGYTVTPTDGEKAVSFYFSNTSDMPTAVWWSAIHMHGWTGSYNSWELAGPASNTDQSTQALYVRTSKTASGTVTWGSWRKIYDSSNKPTASEVGALASTTKYAASSSVGGPATNVATTVTNGTENTARYGIAFVADPSTSNAQAVLKNNDFRFNMKNGTDATGNTGNAEIVLGNSTPSGTAGNKKGVLTLYSTGSYYENLNTGTLTANRTHTLPDANGTIKLEKRSMMYDDTSDWASYSWHKFAEITSTTNHDDKAITFLVSRTYDTEYSGILSVHVRMNGSKNYQKHQFKWLIADEYIDPNNFVLVYTNNGTTSCKIELWYKQSQIYEGWIFEVLKEHTRMASENAWTVYTTSGHGSATYTAGTNHYASELACVQSKTALYTVKGTHTTTTNAWTGKIDATALYDGMTIAYYLPYSVSPSASVTLNLTLSNGTTTGAINCYQNNTTRMTTHYGAGSTIILTYWSAGSISVAGTATTDNRWTRCDYNSNNTVTQNNTTTSASYRVIFSGNANDTNETTTVRKSTNLQFNPSTATLSIGKAGTTTGSIVFNHSGGGSATIKATSQTTAGTYLLPACGNGIYTLSIGMMQVGGTGDSLVMSNVSGIPSGTISFKIVFKSNATSPIYSMVEIPNIGDGVDCGGLIQVGDYSDGSQGSPRIVMKGVVIRVTAGSTTGTKTFTATVTPTQKINGSSVSEYTRNVIMYKIYACC